VVDPGCVSRAGSGGGIGRGRLGGSLRGAENAPVRVVGPVSVPSVLISGRWARRRATQALPVRPGRVDAIVTSQPAASPRTYQLDRTSPAG
jgi:hypothetical protein